MKKLLTTLFLLITTTAIAATQTITFSITSSAKTSTPNLRIAVMKPVLVQAPVAVQSFVVDSIENYYLTKSTTLTYNTLNARIFEIDADQDTKYFIGSDLTNYMVLYSQIPKIITFR